MRLPFTLLLVFLHILRLPPHGAAFFFSSCGVSQRHHPRHRSILKACASTPESLSSTALRHPYDNLQQQASIWGGNSHHGKWTSSGPGLYVCVFYPSSISGQSLPFSFPSCLGPML